MTPAQRIRGDEIIRLDIYDRHIAPLLLIITSRRYPQIFVATETSERFQYRRTMYDIISEFHDAITLNRTNQ